MTKRNYIAMIVAIVVVIIANIGIINLPINPDDERVTFEVTMLSDEAVTGQVYYLTEGQSDAEFTSTQCVTVKYENVGKQQTLSFILPANVTYLRFDPTSINNRVTIMSMNLYYAKSALIEGGIQIENSVDRYGISSIEQTNKGTEITPENEDPYIVWKIDPEGVRNAVLQDLRTKKTIIHICFCIALDLIAFIVLRRWSELSVIPKEIVENRKLIFNLAKNDFKTKFAGSYLGIIWAFVQPIITVLVYWFVFEKALNVGTQSTKEGIAVPYVLWLIAGLVPWFFFSEVLGAGTNVLLEYNYLVKKVVFKISTLPVVKAISSTFVHLFFIAFTLVLYSCYHYFPTLYTLQIIYYSICMILMVLGLIYATSAMVCFFKDLSQVISIVLQVGMWVTPIMWNLEGMVLQGRVSAGVETLLKLNPMYYIVAGYRDSLINQVWFWEKPDLTIYYWLMTILLFVLGTTIFKKLQSHFADVL